MANVQITQLPQAGAITGTEAVPIVQNGQTVQTTTGAIAASPSQTQTFLTVNQEATLPNSRALSGGTGVGLVDGGAQSTLQITLNGASGSLEAAGNGLIAKTASNAVTARSITVSGSGLSVSNGDGIAGNPDLSLTGLPAALATVGGTGMLAVVGGTTIAGRQIYGTAGEILVTDGNGAGDPTIALDTTAVTPGTYNFSTITVDSFGRITSASSGSPVTSISGTADQITVTGTTTPTIAIASNPVIPGTASMTLPKGGTAARSGSPVNGMLRYNTDTGLFEGYINGAWTSLASGSGVTSVATGTGLLGGPITSTGTINIDNTVVATLSDTQTLTNKTISGSSNTLTNIGNGSLTNSSVTINGSTVSLGGSTTITATASNALTIGTGLSGTSYNGSTPVTIAIDSTVATLTGSQTLTNKSISGSTNTLTNIPNSALTNSAVTVGTTAISLGASSLTLAGLTSVEVTQDPTTALQLTTKQYVDGLVSTGLTYHQPTQAATTASLASITGGTVTYNNGTAGVGATLTLSVALTTLDGYSLSNGDRILVKDEANQAYNGVYTWATGGTVLTRATDADTYGTGVNQLSQNDYFFVQNGTVNKGTSYVVTTVGTITFGTTAITFAEFSTSQVYTGTSPIQVSGTVISLNTVPVASGGTNLTSYTAGDLLYASGATTLSKLGIGAANYVLTSSGSAPQYVAQSTLTAGAATNIAGGAAGSVPYNTGSGATSFLALGTTNYVLTAGASAPQYVAQSTLSVGSATTATDATNTAITANSTNATNYLTFVSTTTGNLPQLVNSSITCNPSTGAITGGISGGTF